MSTLISSCPVVKCTVSGYIRANLVGQQGRLLLSSRSARIVALLYMFPCRHDVYTFFACGCILEFFCKTIWSYNRQRGMASAAHDIIARDGQVQYSEDGNWKEQFLRETPYRNGASPLLKMHCSQPLHPVVMPRAVLCSRQCSGHGDRRYAATPWVKPKVDRPHTVGHRLGARLNYITRKVTQPRMMGYHSGARLFDSPHGQ